MTRSGLECGWPMRKDATDASRHVTSVMRVDACGRHGAAVTWSPTKAYFTHLKGRPISQWPVYFLPSFYPFVHPYPCQVRPPSPHVLPLLMPNAHPRNQARCRGGAPRAHHPLRKDPQDREHDPCEGPRSGQQKRPQGVLSIMTTSLPTANMFSRQRWLRPSSRTVPCRCTSTLRTHRQRSLMLLARRPCPSHPRTQAISARPRSCLRPSRRAATAGRGPSGSPLSSRTPTPTARRRKCTS